MAYLENGYICGNAIPGDGKFFVRRQNHCGDYIEAHYYNPAEGIRGKRITTADICAICYEGGDMVSVDEIRSKIDVGDKIPLMVCRYCFEQKVEIPCSGGRTNTIQKRRQKQHKKRKQLDKSVERGLRKGRKTVGRSNGRVLPRSVAPAQDF